MTEAEQQKEPKEQIVRLASIVAIDVAGFSTMSERDQSKTAAAIEKLRTRIENVAAANNGRIFNTAGDGFMMEFGSAGAALGFIQDILDKRPKGQPPIRVGAHVGDVIVTVTSDLLGHGINIAARLQSLAAPNTALVSGEFRSMARSSPSVAFQAKGRQPLENIDQKVQTFAILSSGQRARRMLVRSGVTLSAVAALALLAFFGAHVEQLIKTAGTQIASFSATTEPGAEASASAPPPQAAPAPPAPAVAELPAAPTYKPGDTIRDCETCPELVVTPGGAFAMGSPATEKPRFANEGPVREVTIKPLAIGRYEVTFAEWDACLAASACAGHSPPDNGWGRARRPVIGVSWTDAQAYVDWLSKTTGKTYRLLSEAEWEYAARAGGTGAYGAASRMTRGAAVFASKRTDPVGSYSANAYGLFDLSGNAAEWVGDCYQQSYTGAPVDGSAVSANKCAHRVYRGGAYTDQVAALRVANRRRAAPALRDSTIGFRVARELE